MTRYLLAIGLVLLTSPASLRATTIGTSIGVEFGIGGTQGITSGLNPTDVAGVVPTANWNIASGDSGTLAAGSVVEDTNSAGSIAPGVSVSWATGDTWNNNGTANFANANDNLLNDGYLDGESGGHGTVTFSGLVPGSLYDVYITSTGGTTEDKGGNMVVNGVDDHAVFGDDTSGVYVQSTITTPGNYHFFATTVDDSGDISIITGGSDPTSMRIPISSVELVPIAVVPEPSSLALFGCGAAGLCLAARRRRRAGSSAKARRSSLAGLS